MAWHNGTAVFAFRGTDSFQDFVVDAQIAREAIEGLPNNITGEDAPTG